MTKNNCFLKYITLKYMWRLDKKLPRKTKLKFKSFQSSSNKRSYNLEHLFFFSSFLEFLFQFFLPSKSTFLNKNTVFSPRESILPNIDVVFIEKK